MPTIVSKRPGRYPVRVSLNISTETSAVLDHLERETGETRGVLAREALNKGLVQVDKLWAARRYRRGADSSGEAAADRGRPPGRSGSRSTGSAPSAPPA